MRKTPRVIAGLLAVASMALAGCGSNSLDSGATRRAGTSRPRSTRTLLRWCPQEIKDKGTLTVGTDASYAPSEFFAGDGKTIEGFDIDLFTAVAKKLGLKVKFQNAKFDSIITGVQGKKYDLGISSFTRQRRPDEAGQHGQLLQRRHPVGQRPRATRRRSTPPSRAASRWPSRRRRCSRRKTSRRRQKACKKAGKPLQGRSSTRPRTRPPPPSSPARPTPCWRTRRSWPTPSSSRRASSSALGDIYDSAPYGYVVPKADTDLANAIVAALKSLDTDGDVREGAERLGRRARARSTTSPSIRRSEPERLTEST